MFWKQVAKLWAIGVALTCVVGIPLASLASESQNAAPSDEQAVLAVAETKAPASTDDVAMPDLKRAGKSNPKKEAVVGESADAGKKTMPKAKRLLTAVRPRVQDAPTKADKEAPIPKDAILGIRNLYRQHQDIPTERMVASIGEQARYLGLKSGVPASILIAKTVADMGTHVSPNTAYRIYGEYVEKCSRDLADAYTAHNKSPLQEGLSYGYVLGSLQDAGILSEGEAASLADMIASYGLDRYDEPLPYTVTGTIVDASTGQERDLQYSDYVNLERIVTSYIGAPYVWGGSNEATGFDCSGLVQWSCNKALNVWLPRTTYVQQYVGESVPLDVDELRMGDLLFFHTPDKGTHHVAMYLADGYYVHAPCCGDVVKIASMEEFAPTFARRVISFEDVES